MKNDIAITPARIGKEFINIDESINKIVNYIISVINDEMLKNAHKFQINKKWVATHSVAEIIIGMNYEDEMSHVDQDIFSKYRDKIMEMVLYEYKMKGWKARYNINLERIEFKKSPNIGDADGGK